MIPLCNLPKSGLARGFDPSDRSDRWTEILNSGSGEAVAASCCSCVIKKLYSKTNAVTLRGDNLVFIICGGPSFITDQYNTPPLLARFEASISAYDSRLNVQNGVAF